MTTWNTYKLGELIDVQNGYAFKSSELKDFGTPVIKIKNIQPPNISFEDVEYYPFKVNGNLNQFLVRKKDILISMTGSHVSQISSAVGKVGRYGFSGPALLNQRVGKLYSKDKSKLINDYLYYLISRSEVQFELATNAGGSANQANISPNHIKDLEFDIPDVETQTRIASFLTSLDNKKELNRRTNQSLQKLALTLFKKYFIENIDPDSLPDGWRLGILEELFILQRGFDLPNTERKDGKVPVFAASGLNGYHNKAMVNGPGITTGRSGVIGNVFYITEDFWPLNTSLYIKEFKISTPLHAYYVLLSLDLKSLNGGSAVPTLNRNHVHSLEVIIPPRMLIEKFEAHVQPFFRAIRKNELQNSSLSKICDTLLPKLMTGEIDLSKLESKQPEELLELTTA